MRNSQQTPDDTFRKRQPNKDEVPNEAAIDLTDGDKSLCRWIAKGHRTTWHDNDANFKLYDEVLFRGCAEIAKVPLLLTYLEDTVKSIGADKKKLHSILNYANRTYTLKNPERFHGEVAKRLFEYRPDLEQLDGMPDFLGVFLEAPQLMKTFPGNFASIGTIRKAIPVLEQLAKDGRAIVGEIVPANVKFVISVANRFLNRGLSLEDLVQVGNLGMHKAAQRFEISRGFQFPTYAVGWVRQGIKRAIADTARGIRLPVHMGDFISQVTKCERSLQQELERLPTEEEIADELGADIKKVKLALSARDSLVSLSTPLGEDSDECIGDNVADLKAPDPSDEAMQATDQAGLNDLVKELPERDQKVLKLRFGLEDGIPRTLEDVGEHYGVTRERIRQIQEKALEKLRGKMKKLQRLNID